MFPAGLLTTMDQASLMEEPQTTLCLGCLKLFECRELQVSLHWGHWVHHYSDSLVYWSKTGYKVLPN